MIRCTASSYQSLSSVSLCFELTVLASHFSLVSDCDEEAKPTDEIQLKTLQCKKLRCKWWYGQKDISLVMQWNEMEKEITSWQCDETVLRRLACNDNDRFWREYQYRYVHVRVLSCMQYVMQDISGHINNINLSLRACLTCVRQSWWLHTDWSQKPQDVCVSWRQTKVFTITLMNVLVLQMSASILWPFQVPTKRFICCLICWVLLVNTQTFLFTHF